MKCIEPSRETNRWLRWLENLAQDLRYGVRMLGRNVGFTLVAVLTLGLGIGANTAIFSIINAVLLRPLPFHEPDRLVWITNPALSSGGVPGMTRSVTLREWRELNVSFENLGCYIPYFGGQQLILTLNDQPIRIDGTWVDGDLLKVLGVSPQLGRYFVKEDGHDAVLLTFAFWRQRFEANPAIVGKSITIAGRPWTVVGVLPSSFDFSSIFMPGTRVDFLRPSPTFGDMSDNSHAVIGRLKPGVTLGQAQMEFDRLNRQLRTAHPERDSFGAQLLPLREHVSGQYQRPFFVLACAVGCVLLIACVNLSNLLIARGAARRKEIAIRLALGVSRSRLLCQMLTESILLAICGASLGLPLAYAITGAVANSHVFGVPLLSSARVDGLALAFMVVTACSAAVLFGMIPGLLLSQADVQADLRQGGRGLSDGKRGVWVRKCLVVLEVAMACVLLVGAGLLLNSFIRLLQVDLGFRPDQVAGGRLRFHRDFATRDQEAAYIGDLSSRLAALPGIESVGFAASLPFSPRELTHVCPKGETYRPGEAPSVFVQGVGPGFLETLRIPMIAGRKFDSHDAFYQFGDPAKSPVKVLVNERMARSLWPIRSAVGQDLILVMNDPKENVECRVVGVVGNVRQSPLEREVAPQLYIFGWGPQLVVRSREHLGALVLNLREALRQSGSDLLIEDFKSLNDALDQAVSPKRLLTLLVGSFSLLALLLASIGIYGVISYSVIQRTREIGMRLALGSTRTSVQRLILSEGLGLTGMGCVVGLVVSLALTKVIQALLFEVSPTDPLTLSASGLVLLVVAFLACWLPARRAAGVDPMVALRHE
jgi:predicted permease